MNVRFFRWLLVFLPMAWLAGCASFYSPSAVTNAALLDPSRHYESQAVVELLDVPPARTFRKIARMETLGNEAVTSEVFLIESMRAKAQEIGAQAIVVPFGRVRKFTPDGMYWVVQGDAIRYEE